MYFSRVLETREPPTEAQADLAFSKAPPPDSYIAIFLLCPYMMGKGKKALWGLFYKGINSVYEGTPLVT